jgi:hypothetical protein
MNPTSADTFEMLSHEIITVCGHLHGGEYRLIELIRRLEALRPWRGSGCSEGCNEGLSEGRIDGYAEMPDCAHWLSAHCEMDLVTAREKVRIAHALDDLPLIREAFRTGELSYSKVRALTRIAEGATEAELIERARHTTAEHLAQWVRAARQAEHLSAPGGALDADRHRYLDYHFAADGSVVFEGRLPAEQGALLLQALERARDWLFAEEEPNPDKRINGPVPPEAVPGKTFPKASRADALALIGERFLARPPEPDEGLNTADRFLITVHAPAEALPEYAAINPEDPPEFEDGAVAAPESVRRLCCDAAVVRILESGEGEPLDVGRRTRVIPPAIRRALKRRDGGCTFPGCTNTRFVDGHHIQHWADGGETRLDNLVSLCRFHHRLVHEGGYYIVRDGAAFRFFRGDGLEIRTVTASMQEALARARRESWRSVGEPPQGPTAPAWQARGYRQHLAQPP